MLCCRQAVTCSQLRSVVKSAVGVSHLLSKSASSAQMLHVTLVSARCVTAAEDFTPASSSIAFGKNESHKAIQVAIRPTAHQDTVFQVVLAPDPSQPTLNGVAYINKRKSVCNVTIVADSSVAHVRTQLLTRLWSRLLCQQQHVWHGCLQLAVQDETA